jgi:heme/copper-type cytochrome/quinol oxidase subunit 2
MNQNGRTPKAEGDRRPAGRRARRRALAAAGAAVLLAPHSVWACAACYGQSDSPLARGMNWGILSLLGIVVLVLSGVAGFFVYLAKKSAAAGAELPPAPLAESTQER